MPNKNQIGIVLGVAVLLLLPLLAMQLTREVAWGPVDFAVAGVLLAGTGLLFELAVRKASNLAYRAAVGIALAATLLLIWINLAVGIIGNEGNPANLMYGGVLAVGLIGAVVARFRPGGMARALFATALAQALVAVIALVARLDATVLLDGFFAAMWIGSALLFQRANATGSRLAQPA
jgi:hypothetical protein